MRGLIARRRFDPPGGGWVFVVAVAGGAAAAVGWPATGGAARRAGAGVGAGRAVRHSGGDLMIGRVLARLLGRYLDGRIAGLEHRLDRARQDVRRWRDLAEGREAIILRLQDAVATVTGQRDEARREADALYTDLVGVSDELSEVRAELEDARAGVL